jgi:hypothetical protein
MAPRAGMQGIGRTALAALRPRTSLRSAQAYSIALQNVRASMARMPV